MLCRKGPSSSTSPTNSSCPSRRSNTREIFLSAWHSMALLWDLALCTICLDTTSSEECALLAFHSIWFSALHGDPLLPCLSLTNSAVDFSATMWHLGSTRWPNMRSRKLCAPGPTPDLWSPYTRNLTLTSGFESSTQNGHASYRQIDSTQPVFKDKQKLSFKRHSSITQSTFYLGKTL